MINYMYDRWSLIYSEKKFVCEQPDKVVDDNIWNPKVLDDVRSHVDFSSRPVGWVIQNHPTGKGVVKGVHKVWSLFESASKTEMVV